MMETNKARTIEALSEDGMGTLDDYVPGATLLFVDGMLLEDSLEVDEARAMLKQAEGYGEIDCWIYTIIKEDD